MTKSSISTARNDALLLSLARGEPLAAALQTAALSPARAWQILRSGTCRRRAQTVRRLQSLQRSLILRAAVPDALAAVLRALRDDQKPELQLKAASAILQLTIPKAARRPPKPPPPPPEDDPMEEPEMTEEQRQAARQALREEVEQLEREDAERYARMGTT
jgi:hypothetical protein